MIRTVKRRGIGHRKTGRHISIHSSEERLERQTRETQVEAERRLHQYSDKPMTYCNIMLTS